MWTEARIVQLLNGIFHVFVTQKLDHTGTIFVGISKANIARLTHVILQVLPWAWSWQACYHDTILWTFCWRASSSHSSTTIATPVVAIVTTVTPWSTPAGKFDTKTITIIVISITGFYCIIRITVLPPKGINLVFIPKCGSTCECVCMHAYKIQMRPYIYIYVYTHSCRWFSLLTARLRIRQMQMAAHADSSSRQMWLCRICGKDPVYPWCEYLEVDSQHICDTRYGNPF